MQITDLLVPERVALNMQVADKAMAIHAMVGMLDRTGGELDADHGVGRVDTELPGRHPGTHVDDPPEARGLDAAEGDGPVNALDKAVRKALERFYPEIGEIRLTDYKVRVLDSDMASAARVRVLIESTDHRENWTTIGVSTDIIDASWRALVDSIEYKLVREQERRAAGLKLVLQS